MLCLNYDNNQESHPVDTHGVQQKSRAQVNPVFELTERLFEVCLVQKGGAAAQRTQGLSGNLTPNRS